MESDYDGRLQNRLYPTLHATRMTEKHCEMLGLNTRAVTLTVEEIEQGLADKNWMVRLAAVQSLGALGKQAELVLMRMVHDENECVRLLAQHELRRLALEDSSLLPIEQRPQEASSSSEWDRLEQLSCGNTQAKDVEIQKQQYPLTWRELLEVLLEDSYALEMVTKLLHVSRETLMNWIQYKETPPFRVFHQILDAFPDDYDELLELIQREFPHFIPAHSADGEAPRAILTPFYNRIAKNLRESPPTMRLWSTGQLILRQAMQQLAPYRTGMIMAIMLCTAPAPGKSVRSLHGYLALESSKWMESWDQQPSFFGSDSLCGYAATVGETQVLHDLKSDLKGISFYDTDDFRSILAVPILAARKCAGCLYTASTAPDYFGSCRIKLVQQYTQCLAEAFSPEEFYAPERMQLACFPYKGQISYFNTRPQHMQNTARMSEVNNLPAKKDLHYIEEELLSFIQKHQALSRTRPPSHQSIVELGIQEARPQVEAELFALLTTMYWNKRGSDPLAQSSRTPIKSCHLTPQTVR